MYSAERKFVMMLYVSKTETTYAVMGGMTSSYYYSYFMVLWLFKAIGYRQCIAV